MAGTLAPFWSSQFFDDSGNPLNGGFIYTYAAGTSTPATTYTDSALSVANANPIVLDSAGRCTIFLALSSYKFVLKTSAGVTIETRDNISSTAVAASAATDNGVCEGRLTLTSGTPVTTADVTAATTVYFTPYGGNRIALYDGSSWSILTFSELNIALGTDTINKNYDVFAFALAGVAGIERLVWTNDTTRATALVLQDGVLVKSGDTTRRYLGTYRTTAAGQTEDSLVKRLLWNYYNRVRRGLRVTDATDTWTYTTATIRQANGSTANQVAFVIGVAEVLVDAAVMAIVRNSGAAGSVAFSVGIGEDVTNAYTTGFVGGDIVNFVPNCEQAVMSALRRYPAPGYHFWAWCEYSVAAGTTTWYGDNGIPARVQSGLHGSLDG